MRYCRGISPQIPSVPQLALGLRPGSLTGPNGLDGIDERRCLSGATVQEKTAACRAARGLTPSLTREAIYRL